MAGFRQFRTDSDRGCHANPLKLLYFRLEARWWVGGPSSRGAKQSAAGILLWGSGGTSRNLIEAKVRPF